MDCTSSSGKGTGSNAMGFGFLAMTMSPCWLYDHLRGVCLGVASTTCS